jgi:HlyD family secretion protein
LKGIYGRVIWIILIVVVATTVGIALTIYSTTPQASRAITAASLPNAGPSKVASLGRIEPKDGILRVSARSLSGQPSIVSAIQVKEGDRVKAGQILAYLDSRRQLEAAVRDLDANVAVARNRLAQASTGAKQGDVAAQQAEIARLEGEVAYATNEFNRIQSLYEKGAATVVDRDHSRATLQSTTQMLNQARSRLTSLAEVRDVDVKLAEAGVQSALATAERARVELQASEVHAAIAGQVLKIYAHPGEEVGPQGILELARTDEMYVIAEVFESDVNRVEIGQAATITGEALKEPLHGKVDSIGLLVAKNNVLKTDPASLTDARVVEVKIRLDDSARAARLIYAKVTVVIGN